jgi:peptidoglycan/xylan/chitin deacetylase (PgdA/CDA1 family)
MCHNRGRTLRLASLYYNALKAAGVTTLARRLSNEGVILCYHNVVRERVPSPWDEGGVHMPFVAFERQMRWLAHNYEVVPLAEQVDRVLRGASLRGVAAVTFDDAYRGVFDHAWPLLQALRIPATVFIVADVPGRDGGFWWDDPQVLEALSPARRRHWLTALQGDGAAIVQSLAPRPLTSQPSPSHTLPLWCRPATWHTIKEATASGLQLGAHSATHRSLPVLDQGALQRETMESRDIIRRRTGVTPEFYAYPYGLWNDPVRQAVREAGYRAAFTLEDGHRGPGLDPWALPRINVPSGIEDAAFQAWAAGLNLRRRLSA